ncbi:MAG: TetR/AcrR family transcriptional regulator [Clostridia bacterium]|nr:TetR/AcrR family transcriptional regulator [Clostridia bacterium]
MPKLIPDLKAKLQEEARRQISELGYGAVSIRSIARGCGVGTGTVYNYFSSKEALVASFLANDWRESVARISALADTGADADTVLRACYTELSDFNQRHTDLFASAGKTGITITHAYHTILRNQIASHLRPFAEDGFTAEFIAEALITWTVEGVPYNELRRVLLKTLPAPSASDA